MKKLLFLSVFVSLGMSSLPVQAADLSPVPIEARTQSGWDLFLLFAAANIVATETSPFSTKWWPGACT